MRSFLYTGNNLLGGWFKRWLLVIMLKKKPFYSKSALGYS